MGATGIPTLDLSRIQATEGRDDQDRPTIVLTDGTMEVVLVGGDSPKDNLAGACQVAGAVWDYQRQYASECRALNEPITVTYIEPGVSEASTAYADADEEARIQELRGTSPSVSGAY